MNRPKPQYKNDSNNLYEVNTGYWDVGKNHSPQFSIIETNKNKIYKNTGLLPYAPLVLYRFLNIIVCVLCTIMSIYNWQQRMW